MPSYWASRVLPYSALNRRIRTDAIRRVRKDLILLGLLVLGLSGCASNSGVVPIGTDTFVVSRQAATGFSGMGTLKADAMAEAYAECQRTARTVDVIEEKASDPPYIFGNFPRVEITFRCLEEAEVSR